MITTTHVVVNALIARRLDRLDGRRAGAFVLGGLAPDLGLHVLSAGAFAWYRRTHGWSVRQTSRHVFDVLFFTDPAWIVVQNTLHAPLVIAGLYAAARRSRAPWAADVRALLVGCAVHAGVDVLTHHDDGPLVLFPLDWRRRFHSPVSYWDPAHHGRVLAPVDLAITVLGGAWLLRRRRHERGASSAAGASRSRAIHGGARPRTADTPGGGPHGHRR